MHSSTMASHALRVGIARATLSSASKCFGRRNIHPYVLPYLPQESSSNFNPIAQGLVPIVIEQTVRSGWFRIFVSLAYRAPFVSGTRGALI